LIVALNGDLERTLVTKTDDFGGEHYCQLCGAPVYATKIKEAPPKKKRRSKFAESLEKYVPINLEMPCFIHKNKPCDKIIERETVEHIAMKLYVAHVLHTLKREIDKPLGKRLIDIYIPSWNTAIECQSSQASSENLIRVIEYNTKHDVSTAFIWGSRAFARLKDPGQRQDYYKLLATVAENTVLSQLPDPTMDGSMRQIVDESNGMIYGPRYYVYYQDRKLWWLHLFKKGKGRLYLGTKHPFQIGGLNAVIEETDIGQIALFCKPE